jgi:hypothetical protein
MFEQALTLFKPILVDVEMPPSPPGDGHVIAGDYQMIEGRIL